MNFREILSAGIDIIMYPVGLLDGIIIDHYQGIDISFWDIVFVFLCITCLICLLWRTR